MKKQNKKEGSLKSPVGGFGKENEKKNLDDIGQKRGVRKEEITKS